MREADLIKRMLRTTLIFTILFSMVSVWPVAAGAASDTTPPVVSIPYASPYGRPPSNYTLIANDIKVFVDQVQDPESGIASATLYYRWPGTVEYRHTPMTHEPLSGLPDRYVAWIACSETPPICAHYTCDPVSAYYTQLGLLEYHVVVTNGAGLTTVRHPLKHMNVDVSLQERIVRPTIGFPDIRTSGDTVVITLASVRGLSTERSSWSVEIGKGHRNIRIEDESTVDEGTDYYMMVPLAIEEVNCSNDYWYSITARIPTDTIESLYDLRVGIDGHLYVQENAVQIVESFSAEPTIYILTDIHIGFNGYPGIPAGISGEWLQEEPNIDEIGIFAAEISRINLIHPDLVILCGDLVDWSNQQNWRNLHNLLKLLEVPVYTLTGNHDYYKDDWWWSPSLPGRSSLQSLDYYLENMNSYLNYSFNYGPFHMVCLDSGYDTEPIASGTGLQDWQVQWLQGDLSEHPSSFIFMHHSAVSTSSHDCITKNVDSFRTLCSSQNVVAVFNGHTHRNESHTYDGVDYLHTASATRSHERSGYRMVRLTGSESYETMPLLLYDHLLDSYRLTLTYAPVDWKPGTEEVLTATIQNRHIGKGYDLSSPLFNDMFLKFVMPAGEYTASAIAAPSVWTPEPETADCEVVAKIDYGEKSLCYVRVDVKDAEPTQFPYHWEYLTTVEVTLSRVEGPPQRFSVGDTVVTTAPLHVRAEPGLDTGTVRTQPTSTAGVILAEDSYPVHLHGYTWWLVQYDDGMIGWSSDHRLEEYIRPGPKFIVGDYVVTTDELYVRDEPRLTDEYGNYFVDNVITTHPAGMRGKIRDFDEPRPRRVMGYDLWEIEWEDGTIGWSSDHRLAPVEVAQSIDVFMLVDLTGSFSDDLPYFKVQAPDLMTTLKSSYPDIRFGLGKFEDYPIYPFGDPDWGDKAYERLIDLTYDTDAVLGTITGLYTRSGYDGPESQLVALYQAATGAGQDLSEVGYPAASIPAGQQANFRDGVVKLFILWTDASFHRPGDPGSIPYPGPSFDETVEAILALDPPMVIGISSGGGGLADLRAIANATNAVAPPGGVDTNGDGVIDIPEGEPLVATIGYSGQGIAAAIESLVGAAVVLPIASAGGPYTGEVGEIIVFDGSGSFDPDGWIVLYEWDFESDGVYDSSSAEPIAEHVYSAEFSGIATLRVTDDQGNTAIGTALVEILPPPNLPPIADAGPDQTAFAIPPAFTAMVTLDGSGSSDPDGDALTYTWTCDGNTASGVNPTVELPLGTTTITLVVNDGKVDSAPDTVNITILLRATVDFDPDVLDLIGRGKYVTAYIELPSGFDVRQIDISSIRLNGVVPALARPTGVGDYDSDGFPDLMVKFDASAVRSLLLPGNQVEITITGQVAGIPFEGTDTIRVIDPTWYSLEISSTTGGSVTVPGEGTFSYKGGTVVSLVATPVSDCYRFAYWTGDVGTIADVTASSTTITMHGDCSIIANFEEQAVAFPDPNLEAAIREAIGKPTGPIYCSDLQELTSFGAVNRNITDLTGLEHCTSLTDLYLFDNQIDNISPLSTLTGLTDLDLTDNQIDDISPLSTLTSLTRLSLQANQISDLSPLSTLTGLTDLQLTGNQIGDLSPLSTLTSLTRLSLQANQISDLSPLSTLTSLQELYLGANQINDIWPLSTLTSLRALYLYMNQIDDISPLSTLTSLTDLDLTDNQIDDISPLSTLTALTYLSLWHNQVRDVSPLVENSGLSEGDYVNLAGNPLSSDSINIYIPQLQARGVTVDY